MTVAVHKLPASIATAEECATWRDMPTAIISDELNRFQAMDQGIRLIGPWREAVAGPALTVRSMGSDNLALHHAVANASPGMVLVAEAGQGGRNAVWGGILHRAAELRGVSAVIIDGFVRDSTELAQSNVPCYARGVVPAGPQKAWGGEVNGQISAGGCPISCGDMIVADRDGVAVVPQHLQAAVLEGCRKRLASEKLIMSRLEKGETTVEIFGLPK